MIIINHIRIAIALRIIWLGDSIAEYGRRHLRAALGTDDISIDPGTDFGRFAARINHAAELTGAARRQAARRLLVWIHSNGNRLAYQRLLLEVLGDVL